MIRAVIGGQSRHLSSWRPSPFKLRGLKPVIDLGALPMQATIAGVPTDYDQLELGSCGPNSVAEVYEHDYPGVKFSRLFLYFFTRATEKDLFEDAGVTIPEMLSVAHTMGICLERTWPYAAERYLFPPPLSTLIEAVKHRVQLWDPVVDLDHLLFEIANNQPVILGFGVPRSMQGEEAQRTGLVAVPSRDDERIGGHCVTAFGYDRARRAVKTTSHYGPEFGDGGCLWLPFEHFEGNNASDLSAIRKIT